MVTLLELIGEHCSDLGHDYPAIADRLNARTTIDNPAKQGNVPKRLGILTIFGAIIPAEARSLYMIPDFKRDVTEAAESGNIPALQALLQIGAELLSAESQAAVGALLAETEPDPSWTPTIPGPSIAQSAGLGTVTPAMVQGVLNP
jgi:hypothetical protein